MAKKEQLPTKYLDVLEPSVIKNFVKNQSLPLKPSPSPCAQSILSTEQSTPPSFHTKKETQKEKETQKAQRGGKIYAVPFFFPPVLFMSTSFDRSWGFGE